MLTGWFETRGHPGRRRVSGQPVPGDPGRDPGAVAFNFLFFEHTLLGKKLQATSQDKDMARLLGIPVATMIMLTFVYSAVLGGMAGILVAPILFVSIGMGSTIALKAFAATIIGGFGDVAGAIVGGLIIGVIESFAAYYISVPYKDAYAFLALVRVPDVPPAGHLRRKGLGKSMSRRRSPRRLLGEARAPIGLTAALSVLAVAGRVRLLPINDYVLNIFMRPITYAIAVLGMVVVLGLCGPDQSRAGRLLRLRRLCGRAGHDRPTACTSGFRSRWGPRRAGDGRVAGPDHAAARRSLPGDDHDQLPADLRL